MMRRFRVDFDDGLGLLGLMAMGWMDVRRLMVDGLEWMGWWIERNGQRESERGEWRRVLRVLEAEWVGEGVGRPTGQQEGRGRETAPDNWRRRDKTDAVEDSTGKQKRDTHTAVIICAGLAG